MVYAMLGKVDRLTEQLVEQCLADADRLEDRNHLGASLESLDAR